MNQVTLGNITLTIDREKTITFYDNQNPFTCQCDDCLNYVSKIPEVEAVFGNLAKDLGIDLYKDVGQGMDELMPNDFPDHLLYLVPYYVIGQCNVDGIELEKQFSGPIWPNTIHAKHKINDTLSLIIINTSGEIALSGSDIGLSIWLAYKTASPKQLTI